MNFIAQRLKVIGFLFFVCSILFGFPLGYMWGLYVSAYITKPYNLDLLGNDACVFPVAFAIIAELLIIGLSCLLASSLLTILRGLRP
jgi:hypothetical protein